MPVFAYQALKEDGTREAGVVDADSPKEARLKLRGRRLHVTGLEGASFGEKGRFRIPFFTGAAHRELPVVTRQMATLLASGLPLMGALNAIIEQVESPVLRTSIMDVRERVAQGAAFSDALGAHSYLFSDLFVNMVRAGEASGTLDKILYRLADFLHAQRRMKSKISAALAYPVVMLIIGTGVVTILMTNVVPKIVDTLAKNGKAALPLPTEILIFISSFISTYWWVFVIAAVGIGVAYGRARKTPGGRMWLDSTLLRIPVLGPLVRKSVISRFALTFATLLESGLPVIDSLKVVRDVVDNAPVAEALDQLRTKIAEGADLASPLKQSRVFPPVVGYMISIGEESGRLEELLKKLAEAYDEEVEIASQRLTSLLEPLMIVGMALVVGFIVLSILLPVMEMSGI